MPFDRDRFKNLMHYVIWRTADREGFGATKLYKVLWFSEARNFVLQGKPITGAAYIREKHGPVPKYGKQIREQLEQEGAIKQWKESYYNHDVWRFKALQSPFPLMLSEKEKQNVDYWITHIDRAHTAGWISEESHDYAWEIASMGEVLPYYAILAERTREPSGSSLEWAKRRAKELGLV